MRKILLVVAAVMCMGGAFAQLSMGPKLGLNVSSLTGDGSNFRAGVNVGGKSLPEYPCRHEH